MGYDSWENVGYKIIDKINSFDETLKEMREDLADIKSAHSELQMKVWGISIGAVAVVTVFTKVMGI